MADITVVIQVNQNVRRLGEVLPRRYWMWGVWWSVVPIEWRVPFDAVNDLSY